jgi:hypothetical protein
MRYPILTKTKTAELAAQMVGGSEPSVEPQTTWVGTGADVDLRPIATVAVEITEDAQKWTDKDRDRFEGKASAKLYETLSGVPPEVLDNRGFWRYLALRYFWTFIAWREQEAFVAGNHLKYLDASTNTEAVLPRMYIRAQAVGGSAHADLAAALTNATDFWRSHVLRVRTGSAPALARAFTERQVSDRLVTNPLREAAKRLNRNWTNVVLNLYDDDEARRVINKIWDAESDG